MLCLFKQFSTRKDTRRREGTDGNLRRNFNWIKSTGKRTWIKIDLSSLSLLLLSQLTLEVTKSKKVTRHPKPADKTVSPPSSLAATKHLQNLLHLQEKRLKSTVKDQSRLKQQTKRNLSSLLWLKKFPRRTSLFLQWSSWCWRLSR